MIRKLKRSHKNEKIVVKLLLNKTSRTHKRSKS